MKALFDTLSIKLSSITTRTYSTSFSLGILFLGEKMRAPIYSIYGFVRFADEIVDSFEGFDQKELLKQFREDTYNAIEMKISINPILNSFQHVVHAYNIDRDLIDTFLHSMEMDLEKRNYTRESYDRYILGSAEVVGLMCLCVFTEGDRHMYEKLKPSAMKLGSAFQKVNFLRDLKSDYNELGRSYFPDVDMQRFGDTSKMVVEGEIETEFRESLEGIKQLPPSSRAGVYLAYVYYRALFRKIKKIPAKQILEKRIRIGNGQKIMLMLNSLLQYKMKLI